MAYVPYEKVLSDHLKGSSLMRHLFNKIREGIVCRIYLDSGLVYEGRIKSIDIVWRAIELITSDGKTVYMNFRHIVAIEYSYVKDVKDMK